MTINQPGWPLSSPISPVGDALAVSKSISKSRWRRTLKTNRCLRQLSGQTDDWAIASSLSNFLLSEKVGKVAAYVPLGSEPNIGPLFFDQRLSEVDFLLPRLFESTGESLGVGHWGWYVPVGPPSKVADSEASALGPSGPGPSAPGPETPLEQPRTKWPAQPRSTATQESLSSVELILLPALAVDRAGTRLGKGGGWYDRSLSVFPASVPRLAIVFSTEIYEKATLPRQQHDWPVDGVVSELGVEFF